MYSKDKVDVLSLEKLRIKAETKSSQKINDFNDSLDIELLDASSRQLKSLVHELKVYQVELEIQNEELRQTQTALNKTRLEYQELFEFAPVGYFILNEDGVIQDVNQTGLKLIGYDNKSCIRLPFVQFICNVYKSLFVQHLKSIVKHKKPNQIQVKIERDDGYTFHALIESILWVQSEEADIHFRVVLTDIEDIYNMRRKEYLAAKIIDNSIEGVVVTDQNGIILSINKTFTSITGYKNSEAVGQPISLLNSGKHDKGFYENLWYSIKTKGIWEGEIWNQRKDGEIYQEWLEINSIKDEQDKITHFTGKFSDLSQFKKAKTRLHFLAHFDLLTELPNRTLFYDRLTQSIRQAERFNKKSVIFFLDLDGFKSVNDSLGHDVGDELLKAVAKRLKSLIRKVDTISRLGGDEFTIIANDIENQDQILGLAEKILQAFIKPFIVEHRKLYIGTSIGISVFPDDALRSTDLLKYADTAMYKAKESGRNQYCFYTPKMGQLANSQMLLERELRDAIEKDELVLHYQPQYELSTGKLCGVEALLRWYHPDKGLILPNEFIEQAEKTNLIIALGEWVLNKVCEQGGKWLNEGKKQVRIAVNISPKQFHNKDFEKILDHLILINQFNSKWLELEITEQSLMQDVNYMIKLLHNIKSQGVSLAIDDFGTGYSSMSYLTKFPIDTLKIDRIFIKDMIQEREHEAITSAIIAMGHGLGITVLAEGVETEQQTQLLKNLGCNEVQGFLYNKPMTAQEISLILE